MGRKIVDSLVLVEKCDAIPWAKRLTDHWVLWLWLLLKGTPASSYGVEAVGHRMKPSYGKAAGVRRPLYKRLVRTRKTWKTLYNSS